jgi:hypothetical protein
MFDAVYSLMEDVKQCLQVAEKVNCPTLRSAIVEASHDALIAAADRLPKTEPKKRYILPVKPKIQPVSRPNMPWTPTKADLNTFRSEMLIFLREAFPERNPKANMAEVAYLWTMSKEAGTLEDIIKCAKLAVTSASEDRLRSMSEEAV